MATIVEPPEFELPQDSEDPERYEIWSLRAPANVEVAEIFNEVTLRVDSDALLTDPTKHSNNLLLARFKSEKDGKDYELSFEDSVERDNLRLLVRGNRVENKLTPCEPFRRQVNLTSVSFHQGAGAGDSSSIQTDLYLAPAKDRAPKPALSQSGNGAVDKMRLAYEDVPQKEGLKRRWAMPGSRAQISHCSITKVNAPSKKARTNNEPVEVEIVIGDDDVEILATDINERKKKGKSKHSTKMK